jgi:hypothetical protein
VYAPAGHSYDHWPSLLARRSSRRSPPPGCRGRLGCSRSPPSSPRTGAQQPDLLAGQARVRAARFTGANRFTGAVRFTGQPGPGSGQEGGDVGDRHHYQVGRRRRVLRVRDDDDPAFGLAVADHDLGTAGLKELPDVIRRQDDGLMTVGVRDGAVAEQVRQRDPDLRHRRDRSAQRLRRLPLHEQRRVPDDGPADGFADLA